MSPSPRPPASATASVCRTGAEPAAQDPLRRSAPPRRARAHPVRRVRRLRRQVEHHAAARRAHQPPRRRLHHVAPWFPAEPRRRTDRDQPRRRPARRRRQQGVVPRRRTRRGRHLQHGLEEVSRRPGHRRAASSPRARERREEGQRPAPAGCQARREGHQGDRRAEHGQARRQDDGCARRCAGGRQGRAHPLPEPAPCGKTPLMAKEPPRSTGRWRSSPASTSRSIAGRVS